jgi:integrase
MANNVSILFWLKTNRINKKGLAPLMLRISFNQQRKEFSTGLSIEPSKWDKSRYRVKNKTQEAIQINQYIDGTKAKIMSIFKDMVLNEDISLDRLTDRFLGKDEQTITLMKLVKYHNENFKSRIGIDFAFSTYEKYDITARRLESFLLEHYKKPDFKLKDLNHRFISEFDYYLKSVHKNDHNTTTKYCKNLKKILNVAVSNNWIESNPFQGFRAIYKEVDRVYLSKSELMAIEAKTFKLQRLQIAKDIFLFQCYTGLAFCDMANLTKSDISIGIDNNQWISIRRKKTDTRSAIPLLPQALRIIEKYKDYGGDNLLPCTCIQKFNNYLHELAELCGINKNLTSHVGRRTFATTIALANGIGLETISKVLGHSSTKITQIYAVVTDLKLSEDMKLLKERLQ